jgi:hypothetical protein
MTNPTPLGIANAKPIHPNLFMLCPNPVTRILKARIRLIPSTPTFGHDVGSSRCDNFRDFISLR